LKNASRRRIYHQEQRNYCLIFTILTGLSGLFVWIFWPSASIKLININECNGTTHCNESAFCYDNTTDVMDDFTCTCYDGFYGDGFSCLDFDECKLETYECETNQICLNNPGNYTCNNCTTGWTKGDGNYCDDVDECTNSTLYDCPAGLLCTNTQGKHTFVYVHES
jgi:hypothetical protein